MRKNGRPESYHIGYGTLAKMGYLQLCSGPLRNRATLFEWISAIHFEGEMIQMLKAGDLLHPKDWLGGGKSNGRIYNPGISKTVF